MNEPEQEKKGKQKRRKKPILSWVVIPIVGGFVIASFFCSECISEGNYVRLLEQTVVSAIFWAVLANGNDWLAIELDKRWDWFSNPLKRFIIGVLVLMVYTIAAATLVVYLYVELYLNFDFVEVIDSQGWISSITPAVLITIFIALFIHGKEFLFAWREAALDVERLKNKNLSSQYESLKNQVNPHFLFNSLNALSSLVYSNQDKAVEFIRKLADVYRYVLDHQFDEVVQLKTEMEFVESFIYLNKIRFGENLRVDIQGKERILEEDNIPPIAVQMLLENAFKHNVVSKDSNLEVKVSISENYVSVSNNVHLKPQEEDSSGVGLNNIRSRYGFLTDLKMEVNQTENSFEVKLPILKMKS